MIISRLQNTLRSCYLNIVNRKLTVVAADSVMNVHNNTIIIIKIATANVKNNAIANREDRDNRNNRLPMKH